MTAHKHAALIKAKADNMELVVFCRDSYDNTNKWQETSHLPIQEEFDYFLCLPDRNIECLHWLSEGEVEFRREGESWQDEREKYHGWTDYCGMMNPDVEFRVKPRKEKRWICITEELEIEDGTLYESYADADENSPGYKQIVEIEVEV